MPTTTNIKMLDLRPGEKVEVLFHGSKNLGNDPWTDTLVFTGFHTDLDNGELYAQFEGNWSAYRINNRGRWRYGSSAEPLTILRRL